MTTRRANLAARSTTASATGGRSRWQRALQPPTCSASSTTKPPSRSIAPAALATGTSTSPGRATAEMATRALVDPAVVRTLVARPAARGERPALPYVGAIVGRLARVAAGHDLPVVGPESQLL